MSGRGRIMGAGNGGASNFNVNPHLNTAGGFKKEGLTSRVGLGYRSDRRVQIKASDTPYKRNLIFCMNQLGGVGAGHSMFYVAGKFNRPDAAKRCDPYPYVKTGRSVPRSSRNKILFQ